MNCAICGGEIAAGRETTITVPTLLAGQSACGWCGDQLKALLAGELTAGLFRQLTQAAGRRNGPAVLQELSDVFASGGHGPTIQQVAASRAEEAQRSEQAATVAAAMPVTSGFNIEGSRISRYLGFMSAEVVLGMGVFRQIGAEFADFFGAEALALRGRLNDAKTAAFDRLRADAASAGGNAIIGIDLDYTMFGTSLVGVIASGTAVVIEPAE